MRSGSEVHRVLLPPGGCEESAELSPCSGSPDLQKFEDGFVTCLMSVFGAGIRHGKQRKIPLGSNPDRGVPCGVASRVSQYVPSSPATSGGDPAKAIGWVL